VIVLSAAALGSPHQPETFDIDLDRVFEEALPERMLPGHRGWVVASQRAMAGAGGVVDVVGGWALDAEGLTVLDAPLWSCQGIAMARYAGSESAVPTVGSPLTAFRAALAREELRILAVAATWCHDFLSSRRSGSQRLSSHPAVKLALARLTADVWALRAADPVSTIQTPEGRAWLIDEVDSAANQVIKLAGGRAMLRGHAVQLQALLLLLNRTYLEG
jgi:hypothetical protein